MQKIKIRLPATLTNFGVALENLGLALSLYTQVEFSPREDSQLIVETFGEGAGEYALGLRHPVVLGMARFFQLEERAPQGVHIRVQNDIPLRSGLGAETAFMLAGVIGGNNLLGSRYGRDELIQVAIQMTQRPYNILSAMLGGLTCHMMQADALPAYRSLPLAAFKVIVAMPQFERYSAPLKPEKLDYGDYLYNAQRLPLLLEALKHGDVALLASTFQERLFAPQFAQQISGFAHVAEVARLAGALGVTTSGMGPAMIFLAHKAHDRIAEAIETAFRNLEIKGRVVVAPLDTQGVVISMMQSS